MKDTNKKLLLVGPSGGVVHLKNYFYLIEDLFDEILVVTNNEIDYADFRVVSFSFKNPLKIRKSIGQIRNIIHGFNPSVIHIHQANTCAYMTAKANKGKFPIVLTCWGTDVLVLPHKGRIFKHIVKYALKKADIVTVDAVYMMQAVDKLVNGKKIVLANFGIELSQVDFPEKEKTIYSNRLHHELYKIDEIINGFADFSVNNPDWKLLIGANGLKTEELKKLAESKLAPNTYEFIGFVDKERNMQEYLKAYIWISVPESDGTAISLLEAMGYGCVPVVSDLPANKEWIEDGKNGIVVSGTIKDALTAALNLDLNVVQRINTEIIHKKGTKEANRALFLECYNLLIN